VVQIRLRMKGMVVVTIVIKTMRPCGQFWHERAAEVTAVMKTMRVWGQVGRKRVAVLARMMNMMLLLAHYVVATTLLPSRIHICVPRYFRVYKDMSWTGQHPAAC